MSIAKKLSRAILALNQIASFKRDNPEPPTPYLLGQSTMANIAQAALDDLAVIGAAEDKPELPGKHSLEPAFDALAAYSDSIARAESVAQAGPTPPFWLVWNPAGMNPKFRHTSYGDALTEAKRLARLAAGQKFYVVAIVAHAQTDVLSVTEYASADDDGRPF